MIGWNLSPSWSERTIDTTNNNILIGEIKIGWRQLPLTYQNLFKSFPKLWVEDGVDDRVEEGVHVSYPGGEDEHGRPRGQVGVAGLDADGVHDVTREEGHPAHKEGTCRRKPSFILLLVSQLDSKAAT